MGTKAISGNGKQEKMHGYERMGNLGPYIELMPTTNLFSLGVSVCVSMSMTNSVDKSA